MTIVNSITAIRQPSFAPSSSRNGQHHPAAQRARSGAFVHGGSGGRVGRKQYGTAVVAHGGVSAGSSRAGSAEWPMAANNVVPIEAPARAPTVHQVPYSASRHLLLLRRCTHTFRASSVPTPSMHPRIQCGLFAHLCSSVRRCSSNSPLLYVSVGYACTAAPLKLTHTAAALVTR